MLSLPGSQPIALYRQGLPPLPPRRTGRRGGGGGGEGPPPPSLSPSPPAAASTPPTVPAEIASRKIDPLPFNGRSIVI